MRVTLIPRDDGLRPQAEQLIAEVYARHYAARITTFPDTLVSRIGADSAIDCAAGLRFAADGFFSEAYLDAPVEMLLSALPPGSPREDLRGHLACQPRAASGRLVPAQDHRLRRGCGLRVGLLHRHPATQGASRAARICRSCCSPTPTARGSPILTPGEATTRWRHAFMPFTATASAPAWDASAEATVHG